MTLPIALLIATALVASPPLSVDAVKPAVEDRFALLPLGDVALDGWLGERVRLARERLLSVDEGVLLTGFRKRPGAQAWIGEHAGKFIDAASRLEAVRSDPLLAAKLSRVVDGLLECQEDDGYLGTYLAADRFALHPGADWDVWVHKYDLLGLLAFWRATGDTAALGAARRIGDLLVATFAEGAGKKRLLSAGTHVGMAATSVLEPMVLLHRATGDPRYLAFARGIVASWESDGGPRILSTLLAKKGVERVANGKAYEMLSNLVGLCELYRTTGERELLDAALAAWDDVVAHHLYVTGGASRGELFGPDGELPNGSGANPCETCVTVTWIQLNTQLLRLTGEARFAEEVERALVNHLAAAQAGDGKRWCYYTPLSGVVPYSPDVNCCASSGPRGFALAPSVAVGRRGEDELAIALFAGATVKTKLGDGTFAASTIPAPDGGGVLEIRVEEAPPQPISIAVRAPSWSIPLACEGGTIVDSWLVLAKRRYVAGEVVVVRGSFAPRVIQGGASNPGTAAVAVGPYVLAASTERDPDGVIANGDALTGEVATVDGLEFAAQVTTKDGVRDLPLVPFAEAAQGGGRVRVWLPARGAGASVLRIGAETRSRPGNVDGSILDADRDTFVVTWDGKPPAEREEWFAVALRSPATIRRVRFAHGHAFHDGGWFDASRAPPRVEVRATADGGWEALGSFADYPKTSATDAAGLRDGQTFEILLPAPRSVAAIRLIGTPACGDDPKQAFVSCAEIEAE